LLGVAGTFTPRGATAQIGVGISVGLPAIELHADVAPPELPVYVQPPAPADGYLWTPGYWRWGDQGYFWVPGTWVEPPEVGLLWTPGWWGWENGAYAFRPGYWGPHVGFYGGVNYGFGYGGDGFAGGRWEGGHFAYNTSVTNINRSIIHNTYNETVINRGGARVSFNGPQGIHAAPTRDQLAAGQEHHVPPTANQVQHYQQAAQNRNLLASVNHGRPAIAATPRPGVFQGAGVVAARPAARRAGAAATTGHRDQGSSPSASRNAESQARGAPAERAAPARTVEPVARSASRPAAPAEARPAYQSRPASEARPAAESRPVEHAQAPQPRAEPRAQERPAAQPAHAAAPKEEHREER
jgi:hypothetical protein